MHAVSHSVLLARDKSRRWPVNQSHMSQSLEVDGWVGKAVVPWVVLQLLCAAIRRDPTHSTALRALSSPNSVLHHLTHHARHQRLWAKIFSHAQLQSLQQIETRTIPFLHEKRLKPVSNMRTSNMRCRCWCCASSLNFGSLYFLRETQAKAGGGPWLHEVARGAALQFEPPPQRVRRL